MKQLLERIGAVLAVALVIGSLGAAQAWADVANLAPSKDNSLYQNDGTLSNGAGEFLFAGQTNFFGARRALLAFDVAGAIPAGSTITNVTLSMTVSQSISGPHPTSIHRVLADWGEGASNAGSPGGAGTAAAAGDATWTQRFFPGTPWAAAGGDFAGVASATVDVGFVGPYTWGSTPAMVNDVQAWLNNPAANFGWIVVGNEATNPTAKRFDSRENVNVVSRPALTVTYTPPDGGNGEDPIPTVSEWGLILMALLLLAVGSVLFGRRSVIVGAGGGSGSGLVGRASLFAPAPFARALALVLGVVAVGCLAAFAIHGRVAAVDLTGALLCAPVVAYLVHLWMTDRQR